MFRLEQKIKSTLNSNYELLVKTALAFIVRLAGTISGFISTVVVSTQLGAKSGGYYFLAFSIVTLLSALGRVGSDNTILRFTGASHSQNDWGAIIGVFRTALIVVSMTSLAICMVLFFYSEIVAEYIFNKPELSEILKAIAPAILFTSLFTSVSMSLQGIGKVLSSIVITNIAPNVFVIVMVLLFSSDTPKEIAFFYSIACLLSLLIGGIQLRKLFKPYKSDRIKWNEFFTSSMPLWVVVLMTQTTQLSGQIITGIYSESYDVARLAVAQKTSALVGFVLIVVNLVVAPKFAALYKQGKLVELKRLALDSIKIMLLIALPIISIILAFPAYIMSFFGEGFEDGQLLLQILIVGQTLNILTGSVGYLLSMSGHEKELRNSVIIAAPISVVLCFVLVPPFGVVGAAISTTVAFALQSLIPAYWVHRRLGINILMFWR